MEAADTSTDLGRWPLDILGGAGKLPYEVRFTSGALSIFATGLKEMAGWGPAQPTNPVFPERISISHDGRFSFLLPPGIWNVTLAA